MKRDPFFYRRRNTEFNTVAIFWSLSMNNEFEVSDIQFFFSFDSLHQLRNHVSSVAFKEYIRDGIR